MVITMEIMTIMSANWYDDDDDDDDDADNDDDVITCPCT